MSSAYRRALEAGVGVVIPITHLWVSTQSPSNQRLFLPPPSFVSVCLIFCLWSFTVCTTVYKKRKHAWHVHVHSVKPRLEREYLKKNDCNFSQENGFDISQSVYVVREIESEGPWLEVVAEHNEKVESGAVDLSFDDKPITTVAFAPISGGDVHSRSTYSLDARRIALSTSVSGIQ